MKKYRVVQLANGMYSVQVRKFLFFWQRLPIEATYPNAAYAHILDLRKKETDALQVKKDLKVCKVHGYA